MESQLQYGSIIKISSENNDYKDKLFFIEYYGENN